MKINQGNKNVYSEKYSEFYKAFQGPLDKVLNSRPVQMDTLNTYVQVEDTEQALSNFFWQNDKSTALLKGPQGTGKSSTIFYMHKRFAKNKTTSSVYFDMRQHQGKIPSGLGEIASVEDRTNALFPKIRDLLASRFSSLSSNAISENNMDDDTITWQAFRYAFRYHHQVIPQRLRTLNKELNSETPDLNLIVQIRDEMRRDFSFQSMFHFIKYAYVLHENMGINRVSIFIDNIDQMPYSTLEASIACANSFSSCATGATVRGVTLGKIKFRFVIACRHYNYERLIERSHLNALGADNHVPINHSGLPSLSEIVEKRLFRVRKFGSYTFKRGIRLVKIDTKSCVKAYFKQLDNSGTYQQVLKLNNNNLAFTLDTIREITKNKYFPSFDDFIENHQIGASPHRDYSIPINASIAAACLVWGNPSNLSNAIYPSSPNQVPNLLSWDGQDIMSFLLPLRIIFLLKRLGAESGGAKMVSLALMYEKFSQCFPTTAPLFLETVISMQRARLLTFYAEEEVREINGYSSFKLSPKAEYLINYGPRYDAFALGFLEDMQIAQPENLFRTPIFGRSLRSQSETVKAGLIKYCYDLELGQLEVIENLGLETKYFSIFPKESLVKRLLQPIISNFQDLADEHKKKLKDSSDQLDLKCNVPVGIHDMVHAASQQAAIPIVLERGTQLLTDAKTGNAHDPKLQEIFILLAELRVNLENNKPISDEKKNGVLKKIGDWVKYGKDAEQIGEWGSELLQAIDNAQRYFAG